LNHGTSARNKGKSINLFFPVQKKRDVVLTLCSAHAYPTTSQRIPPILSVKPHPKGLLAIIEPIDGIPQGSFPLPALSGKKRIVNPRTPLQTLEFVQDAALVIGVVAHEFEDDTFETELTTAARDSEPLGFSRACPRCCRGRIEIAQNGCQPCPSHRRQGQACFPTGLQIHGPDPTIVRVFLDVLRSQEELDVRFPEPSRVHRGARKDQLLSGLLNQDDQQLEKGWQRWLCGRPVGQMRRHVVTPETSLEEWSSLPCDTFFLRSDGSYPLNRNRRFLLDRILVARTGFIPDFLIFTNVLADPQSRVPARVSGSLLHPRSPSWRFPRRTDAAKKKIGLPQVVENIPLASASVLPALARRWSRLTLRADRAALE
jgi:hypothetical protein